MKETYKCEKCGGILEYDVASQSLKCANCDTEVQITAENKRIKEHNLTRQAKREKKAESHEKVIMRCEGCGAMVEFDETCTANECPYCGSNYVLADKQVKSLVPDGVLPFQIDKNKVGEIFAKWIKSRWLAPGELKTLYQKDKLHGIYMPYWTFDAKADCDYTAMGGKDRKVTRKNSKGEEETVTETDWYFTKGHIKKTFDDVLEPASDKLKLSLLEGVEPYNTKEVKPYSPDYMAGYLSEVYTIDLESAHHQAKREMQSELHRMAEHDVKRKYDRVKDMQLDVEYRDETYKHILIPVYSTAYYYKGKQYTVLINGQTGKMKGDYPKSPFKIGILIVIAAVILGIFFFAMTSESKGIEETAIQTEVTAEYDVTAYDLT